MHIYCNDIIRNNRAIFIAYDTSTRCGIDCNVITSMSGEMLPGIFRVEMNRVVFADDQNVRTARVPIYIIRRTTRMRVTRENDKREETFSAGAIRYN